MLVQSCDDEIEIYTSGGRFRNE